LPFLATLGRSDEANIALRPAKVAGSTSLGREKISQRFQWISLHDSLTIPTLGSAGNRTRPERT
jgi:hypothetical protein